MSTRLFTCAAIAACLCAVATAEDKAPAPITGSFNLDYFSKYVWRGINSNDNGVLWPTLTVNYAGFSAYVFGSMEATNWNSYAATPKPAGKFTEYDLGLSYTKSFKPAAVTLGYVNYVFPKTGARQTSEVFASVALPMFLSPTVCVYRDIEATQGTYANLCLTQTFPKGFNLSDSVKLPVVLNGSVGYGDGKHNRYYYGRDEDAFADMQLGVSSAIPVGKNMTLTPSVRYSTLLTDTLLDGAPRRSNLWFGLSFNYGY